MNIMSHEEKIKLLPEVDVIVLSLRFVFMIDLESLESLKHLIERVEGMGRKVLHSGLSENAIYAINTFDSNWLNELVDHGKIWELAELTKAQKLQQNEH